MSKIQIPPPPHVKFTKQGRAYVDMDRLIDRELVRVGGRTSRNEGNQMRQQRGLCSTHGEVNPSHRCAMYDGIHAGGYGAAPEIVKASSETRRAREVGKEIASHLFTTVFHPSGMGGLSESQEAELTAIILRSLLTTEQGVSGRGEDGDVATYPTALRIVTRIMNDELLSNRQSLLEVVDAELQSFAKLTRPAPDTRTGEGPTLHYPFAVRHVGCAECDKAYEPLPAPPVEKEAK